MVRVHWQIVFNVPVTGVTVDEFALTGSPGGSAIESVTPQFVGTFGTTYNVTATLGSGAGALGITMLATGNIVDQAGNPVETPFPGQVYTILAPAPPPGDVISLSNIHYMGAIRLQQSGVVLQFARGGLALRRVGGKTRFL